MAAWNDALRRYRRRSLEPFALDDARRTMFVLCSEDAAGAALVAECNPGLVLQTLGAAREPACPSVRSAFEYAVRTLSIRHVFVCGHAGCAAAANEGAKARTMAARQCEGLLSDPVIGALLRAAHIRPRALWFDGCEGDVYACGVEGDGATLLSDEDLGRILQLGNVTA